MIGAFENGWSTWARTVARGAFPSQTTKALAPRKPDAKIPTEMEERLRQALRRTSSAPLPPSAEHAAVALVLSGDDLDLLLIRRADHPGDPWSGQMALPGGRSEEPDRDLLATAQRETFEEVGIQLSTSDHWGQLPAIQTRGGEVGRRFWVTPHVFHLPGERPMSKPNYEVAEVYWLALSSFSEPSRQTEVIRKLGGKTRTFPAWWVREQKVWGLTHSIVTQLLNLVR